MWMIVFVILLILCSLSGYALTVAKKNDHHMYLTGAPSFEHKGQILLFTNDENNEWEVTTKEYGEQVGYIVSAYDAFFIEL